MKQTIELYDASREILFDPVAHRYTRLADGAELSGITPLLAERLFPDKYSGIPEETLRTAARRGTAVHAICELWDECGLDTESAELSRYKQLKKELPPHERSEYLITDGDRYATCIDKVYRVDGATFDLGDIKTTYALDEEYVSWQLSVSAHLFERQNPGAKVRRLVAIWLRGEQGRTVEVERKAAAEVERLLYAEVFDVRPAEFPEAFLTVYNDAEAALAFRVAEIKRMKREYEELSARLEDAMQRCGVKKFQGGRLSLTLRRPSERRKFDEARFRADHPDLYDRYTKTVEAKGGLLIKIL